MKRNQNAKDGSAIRETPRLERSGAAGRGSARPVADGALARPEPRREQSGCSIRERRDVEHDRGALVQGGGRPLDLLHVGDRRTAEDQGQAAPLALLVPPALDAPFQSLRRRSEVRELVED